MEALPRRLRDVQHEDAEPVLLPRPRRGPERSRHTVRFFPDRTAHIVAISMAPSGWPQALFTVNLVGDRRRVRASRTPQALRRRFQIEESRGDPSAIRFVNLVFRVFLPEIERLQEEKAAALAAFRVAHPDVNPFEDRALEVTSWVEIDVARKAASSIIAG